MADATLHVAQPPERPSLEDQLMDLVRRTSAMEDALRGAVGVFYAIRAGDLLGNLPAERSDWPGHEAALGMLDLLESRVKALSDYEDDQQFAVSCEIAGLASSAGAGKIRRASRGDE